MTSYNTRRKSVSLSQLGIHVPKSSRSSSHRSPPASASTPPAEDTDEQQHPAKKIKRSHSSTGEAPLSPVSSVSPSRASPPVLKDEVPPKASRVAVGAQATPPPESGSFKIDTEGINDEIVVGVIEQLEKTGNRPHLLKELAAILQHTIGIVQRYASLANNCCILIGSITNFCDSSANQPAIISSRLATYMKRSWTALAPCPLGKELVGTHPKRIYFYLTTQPRQPFPDPPERADQVARIISPSLTSAENEEDDKHSRSRAAMSPSPEVDLSPPEGMEDYEAPTSSNTYFSHGHSMSQYSMRDSTTTNLPSAQASPALEGDEREFTQTVTSLQQRRRSESMEDVSPQVPAVKLDEPMIDDSEESRAHHNRSDAAALFGHGESHLTVAKVSFMESSSPMLKPHLVDLDMTSKPDLQDMRLADDFSTFVCDTVEMDELDDLFMNY